MTLIVASVVVGAKKQKGKWSVRASNHTKDVQSDKGTGQHLANFWILPNRLTNVSMEKRMLNNEDDEDDGGDHDDDDVDDNDDC